MKIPQIPFTLKEVQKLKAENDWNEHFNIILWPRILNWLDLSELFNEKKELEWRMHYTPNNMHSNMISAHIIDPNNTFNFYFQIPLKQKLQVNLYLGDSTYNFFEIYPLLKYKGIITDENPPVGATSTILPHLILSGNHNVYAQETIENINENNYSEITKNDPLINLLVHHFNKYIPVLQKIINGEWKLQ